MSEQDFLRHILTALVSHPEAIEIERTMDGQGVLLTARVHKDDMGMVVGKQGKTAEAIRVLLRIIGMQRDDRVSFKIYEPYGSSRKYD